MATPVMEQRERERSRVWLPVRLRWSGGEGFAVTYDASDKGVLMLTTQPIAVGTRVTVTFEVPVEPASGPASGPRERTGNGRVVRSGSNDDDPQGLWPCRVAVALDEVVAALSDELGRLSKEHPLVDARGVDSRGVDSRRSGA